VSLNVVVAGLPKGVQDAADPDEGLWLTAAQRDRITAAAPDLWLEHLPVSELHAGPGPARPPHAIMVETSGSKSQLDVEQGILRRAGLDRLLTPELRLIQSMSAGVENLVDLVPAGVVLANASGVAAKPIAETIIAAILAEAKMLPTRWANQARRVWAELPARELEGTVMTVLGTGNVGVSTATIARALGIRTIGVNRRGNPVEGFDEVVPAENLHTALAATDHLVVAAPLTPRTRGLIDGDALAAMKPGGWVANVARGSIVDPDALVEALEKGHLRGALIDCHITEPLPVDDPLWTAPGAIVLPHDAHASQLLGERQVDLFVDNLTRLARREDLRNVVDLTRGY